VDAKPGPFLLDLAISGTPPYIICHWNFLKNGNKEIITNNSTSHIPDEKEFRSQPSRVKNKHLK
jgi:hypothetical protein